MVKHLEEIKFFENLEMTTNTMKFDWCRSTNICCLKQERTSVQNLHYTTLCNYSIQFAIVDEHIEWNVLRTYKPLRNQFHIDAYHQPKITRTMACHMLPFTP